MAQDVIITRDAKKINAEVIEVNPDDVKYKNFSNPKGPTYTILKNRIAVILYKNGEVEIVELSEDPKPQPAVAPATPAAPVAPVAATTEALPPVTPAATTSAPVVRNQQTVQPRLTGKDLLVNMEKEDPTLYRQYQSGQKQAKLGSLLLISGGALTIGGVIATYALVDVNYTLATVGYAATVVGGLGMTAGVPFTIIGNIKKGRAVRQYTGNLHGEAKQNAPQFQLNLHGNGLGLAYVF